MRILVIEDYEPIRSAVTQALTEDGYAVDSVSDGRDGLSLARTEEHDVIVLDIMLPHTSGLEILRSLRVSRQQTPVLLLTALGAVDQRVQGLDAGADDYLAKPFAMRELLARVRALVRRGHGDRTAIIQVGDLSINTIGKNAVRRTAIGETITIDLTAREYSLLELLARRRGQVLSRTEIWNSLYDMNDESASNVVDVYVGYLRKKLDQPGEPSLIQTRRGHGYVLRGPEP